MAKANKERRDEISTCVNCGKEYHKFFSNKGKCCSIQCGYNNKTRLAYEKLIAGDPSMQKGNYNPKFCKPIILKEQNNKCSICGCDPIWNNKNLVFILDHIDGNASHNIRSNFRMICPNCDSQLDTYKSKNKNSARITRYHRE